MSRIEDLGRRLAEERAAFVDALEAVDLELVTVPGVVENWSVRDLVVHVAFWAEHATRALALASAARGAEFAYDTGQTDAMNARLLEEARSISPSAAIERESAAYDALAAAVDGLDQALLDERLGSGDTVEEVIVYDGPEHYREHTEHLRAWFGEEPDDEEPE